MTPPDPLRLSDRRQVSAAWLGAIVLLVVGLILGVQTEVQHRRQAVRQIAVQADILAASVTAALAFDDRPTIREYVEALRANPQIAEATVYDAAGQPLVSYSRKAAAPHRLGALEPARYRAGVVQVTAPVVHGRARLGAIYLRTLPDQPSAVLGRHSGLALLTLMAFLLLWFVTRAARQLERRASALVEANGRLIEEMHERERVEEALRQSQKMEALGQLTGGVAHDFNNLLTVIMGGIETIGRYVAKLPNDAQTARLIRARDMAMHGAERAATLTQRLLAFSRRQPLQPLPINPNTLVQGMGELLRRTLDETVELESVLGAGVWRTRADPTELENALLNLAVNARDAMPNGGKLTIETANAALDETYAAAAAEALTPGQYVLIAVTDTGMGMDADTQRQAFEPFFTTKDVGKGTGLGLSQVYGFVRQSGGHVAIYSEPGVGTTVKVYLPRYVGEAEGEVADARVQDAGALIGDECVLVVEDHDDLRSYSVSILRELGYKVHEAADAAHALTILAETPGVELLFTDIVLPGGMNGRELADAAHETRPDLKVLFTTGYTRNAIVHNGALDPGVQLISKPFTFDELAAKMRQVLDAAPAALEPG